MVDANEIYSLIEKEVNFERFQELNWNGSFSDYLNMAIENPMVCRNAYQRLHDMIMSYEVVEYRLYKEKMLHYKFFEDPLEDGHDAVYGLDRPLMRLVGHIKSAAHCYGTEKRVLLLHGPVGSSKSTIVRMLKKGIESYSRTPEGAMYSFRWKIPDGENKGVYDCPMHEDPLKIIPVGSRKELSAKLTKNLDSRYPIQIEGSLCPFCRYYYQEILKQCQGDWSKVAEHIEVYRLLLSAVSYTHLTLPTKA